ncbi:MAG TPA: carboxypeptidase-like regulatory domain-containing protein [Bryobacteraceae bacterium]|nr:carboxypeptidase-like regulatory domain-containing protein [Bryobacteraceae bacterium]
MRQRIGRFLLLPAVLAALGHAQTAAPANETPASLSGTVTNSLTGEPVLRAHVSLQATINNTQQRFGAMTNGEGKFALPRLPAGQYFVTVERVGFVAAANGPGLNNNVRLQPGDKKEDFKLVLTPTGAISGRVTDSDGEPVQAATVAVESGMGSNSAQTDDKGQYRIGGLRAGKYRVRAAPGNLPFPAEIRTDGTKDVHNAGTYFPGVLERKSGARVEVLPGAELSGIDIRLVRTPIVTVSGKVEDLPSGAQNVNVQVRLASPGVFSGGMGGLVKPDGSFKISGLDPGKYTLAATQFGQGGLRLQSAPVEIEVAGADIEHLELRMIPPFDISGQMRFEDERARQPQRPPAPQGRPAPPPRPRQVMLRPADGISFGMQRPADIDADDSFTLQGVQPGRYVLSLMWGPAYVKSVRLGDVETSGPILDVRNGANGAALTVVVSSNMCEVSGTVNDSSGPVPDARIALGADPEYGGGNQVTASAADGTYKFVVAPGKYRIAVVDNDTMINAMRQGWELDGYEDVIVNLELQPGDKVTQNLQPKPRDGK